MQILIFILFFLVGFYAGSFCGVVDCKKQFKIPRGVRPEDVEIIIHNDDNDLDNEVVEDVEY